MDSLARLLVLVAAMVGGALTARADDLPWPRCSEHLDGQSLCAQGSVCECHYDGGGLLTGRVAAWRWSCDLLRMCGPPVPADSGPQPLPPGFTYAPSVTPPDEGTAPGLPTLRIGPDGRVISGQ